MRARSRTWARRLAEEIEPAADPGHLAEFAFHLPVVVVASLLGVPEEMLRQTSYSDLPLVMGG